MNHDGLEAKYERLKLHAALLQEKNGRLRYQAMPGACCGKMPRPIGEVMVYPLRHELREGCCP